MISALVYDLEIKKAIQKKGEERLEGIEYCEGWNDKVNMGIAVLCAYDYQEDRYRTFCDDNQAEFLELAARRDILVTFNGLSFDNEVIGECWSPYIYQRQGGSDYDVLVEIWRANGLGPVYQSSGHGGYSLDAMCRANLGTQKPMNGAFAPVEWQRGNYGRVVDYCLSDVWNTKRLFDRALRGEPLLNPKTRVPFFLRRPGEDV